MTDQQRVTDEQLTEWERVADQATPKPWSAADEHGLLEGADPAWCVSRMRPGYEAMAETEGYLYDIAYTTGTNEQADAEFIASAREAVPALVADLRASRAQATSYFERGLEFVREAQLAAAERDEMRANWQRALEESTASDERRLLGPARMVLDRAADGIASRKECAAMAQRIVDLIGHPVTDEPPHALVERDAMRAERDVLQQRIDKALTLCSFAEANALNYNDPKVPFIDARAVRAALTGTDGTGD